MKRKLIVAVMAAGILSLAWVGLWPGEEPVVAQTSNADDTAMVEVIVPELSGDAVAGAEAFAEFCAACHGVNAGGLEGKGPPLIHKIYEPGHHGDFAFVRAAQQGVRSHHWRFGDMPPVEGVSDAEIQAIIVYVRAVQKANGIY